MATIELLAIEVVYALPEQQTLLTVKLPAGSTVAQAIEQLFAETARILAERGVDIIISAGGETSGAVVKGIEARTLGVGVRLAAGVPALRVDDRALAIALKSGNFGDEDFFATAMARLAGDQ